MSEQSTPIDMIFQIGPDRYHAFKVVAWKVRSEHIIEMRDGKLICNCQRFRFESKCPHTQAVENPCQHFVRGAKDWHQHEKQIDWKSTEFKYVILADKTKSAAIHPDVGDLSVFSIIHLLTSQTISADVQRAMDDKESWLNAKRIYAELKLSTDRALSLTNDEVLREGRKLPKLTKKDIDLEEDFDDKLVNEVTDKKPEALIEAPAVVSIIDWRKVKRPNPKSFYVKPEIWEQILYTMSEGGNVLVTGPSGSGKTELAYIAAKAVELPIAAFNFGAMQDPRTSLIGATHFDVAKGTFTRKSRFAEAVSAERGTVLLDELSRDRGGNAHNIILTLLDRQGYMSLDEHEDSPIIRKGAHVCFISTANVGMEYTGTEALDKALRDRMDVVIDMDFPPKEYEVKILMFRCPGLRAGDASRLCDIAKKQRDMTVNDGDFVERISTRMLLAAGKRIGQGISVETALQFCVANHFSNEGGDASERTQIMQIIQKGGK